MFGVSLVTACLLAATLPNTPEAIDYVVTITEQADAPAQIDISVTFTGNADGTTTLILPGAWGGEESLWTGIEALEIVGNGARITPEEDPSRKTIHHRQNQRLTVSYRIVQDWPGIPVATGGNSYRPVVQPEYVQLIGQTVFVAPGNYESDSAVNIQLFTPEAWTLASDLQHPDLTLNGVMTSVLVAGDFRVEHRDMGEGELRVAMRGDWGFEDTEFTDAVHRVIQANHAYWNAPGENFLVTLLPLEAEPNRSSMGGTGLADSFAFFATSNVDEDAVLQILTHEHAHTWIPGRLGGLAAGNEEPSGYWFSEGFTDFIAQRIGVRAGLWSVVDSLESWNNALAEYAASPVAERPNDAIRDGFWTDGDLQRLPYLRGMLFAALIEHKIRTHTGGDQDLDDVLQAMMEVGDTHAIAPDRFLETVLAVTGIDVSAEWQRYIISGERIMLDSDTFTACGQVQTLDQLVFDYGMTGHRDEDGLFVLDSVDPDGPAAPAGFEPGMRFLGRIGGSYGDPTVDSVFSVERDGGSVEMRYRPTRGDILRVQQIIPDPDKVTTSSCSAMLAG